MDHTTNPGLPDSYSGFRSTSQPGFAAVSCSARDSPSRSGASSRIRAEEEEAKPHNQEVVVKVTRLTSNLQSAWTVDLCSDR